MAASARSTWRPPACTRIGGSFWEFGEPDWEHTKLLPDVRRRRGPRLQPDQDRRSASSRRAASSSSRSIRCAPATAPSPTSGSASGPAPTGCSSPPLIHELLRAEQIDLDYLVRYTNAPWLVIQAPGAADDGLFARDDAGRAAGARQADGRARRARSRADIDAGAVGHVHAGRRAQRGAGVPAARRALSSAATTRPSGRRGDCGIPAATIRRIAAELAHAAFEEAIELDMPWTDWAGRRHDKMIGRPVAMHAMRGISAHSNGFHTCRALHLLQMLLGTIDVPGRLPLQGALSEAVAARPQAARQAGRRAARQAAAGAAARLPARARRICWSMPTARRSASTRPIRWDAPLAAHGLMHMVIANAATRRSLPDRHAVHVHGQHGLELVDEHCRRRSRMLTDKDPDDRRVQDPAASSIPTPIPPRRCAYADLILPDTTYLERWDCISLLDRPISRGRRPGRRDPPAGRRARPRRARRSRTCCSISARGSACRASSNEDGTPQISRRLSRLHRQPRAHARHRPARRLARQERRRASARGAPNPRAARALHRQRLLPHAPPAAEHSATSSTPTATISSGRWTMGFIG